MYMYIHVHTHIVLECMHVPAHAHTCVPYTCMCTCHCKSHGLVMLGFVMTFPSLLQKANSTNGKLDDTYMYVRSLQDFTAMLICYSMCQTVDKHTHTRLNAGVVTTRVAFHHKYCQLYLCTSGNQAGGGERACVRGCNQDIAVGSTGTQGCSVVSCHVNSSPSNASMSLVGYKYSIVHSLIAVVPIYNSLYQLGMAERLY